MVRERHRAGTDERRTPTLTVASRATRRYSVCDAGATPLTSTSSAPATALNRTVQPSKDRRYTRDHQGDHPASGDRLLGRRRTHTVPARAHRFIGPGQHGGYVIAAWNPDDARRYAAAAHADEPADFWFDTDFTSLTVLGIAVKTTNPGVQLTDSGDH